MVVELDEAAFRKLEYFSLVSKVCTELTNHLGLDDKNLAEFVIHLAKKNPTFDKFKAALSKKGADFSDALIASILRLVEKMLPKTPKTKKNAKSNSVEADEPNNDTKNEKQELRKKLLPALCLPDEDPAKRRALEEEEDSKMREQDTDGKHAMKFVHPDKESDLKPDIAEFSAVDEAAASDMIKDLEMLLTDAKEKSTLDPKSHRKDTTPMDSKRSPHGRSSRSPSPHSRHRSRDRRASPHEHSPYDSRNSDDRHRRSRNRSRSPDSSSYKPRSNLPVDPVVGEIYQGRVSNILAFGAVVQIEGLRRRCEGLVHISQLRREGRVANVSDVVQRSQKVYVKVLTFTGTRTSLSMREVNQETGEDLNPQNSSPNSRDPADGGKVRNMDDADLDGVRNPDRPTASSAASISRSALFGPRRGDADGVDEDLESGPKRKVQRISSPERWELKQMMSAGVVEKTDLPDFDEETGLLPREDEESDEDIEIELVEEEPPFLKVNPLP
ncbi:ATP-dependent RNA helicase DHX8 [Fasciola gigantica]|uniref:ATP-dependent RNA helicase DHX8 n=1 Tax=Fasciola gigantica TaxID=46835 RepID=A0A504YRU3_FASGI|nr:ATP-dependent RNA helicase DHX8 [Fasciola gigantica]